MTSDKEGVRRFPIDKMTSPIWHFMQNEKAGGVILGISVVIALFLANSPWSAQYFEVLHYKIGLYINGRSWIELSILHWINDALMAIFFFVVGLELKREFVGGELSQPRNAVLPIFAALGGMIVPAIIYLSFNPGMDVRHGWGIPMATDIAFALGVLYLLGDRVPYSLKVFLTALAIVDDLGAVIVIALFYSSDISIVSLLFGLGFALIMWLGNKLGVRNILFYIIVGVGGVWLSFLLSGVHATIAAVLAAFMIPADVAIKENVLLRRITDHLNKFRAIDPKENVPILHEDQVHILSEAKKDITHAIPPLQRLEIAMHPYVSFVVLPIFALANAGVSLDLDPATLFSSNVAIGVALGLLLGKVIGVVGFTLLLVKMRIAPFPPGMNLRNIFGLGLLAAIGFTMSLFVTSLAFDNEAYMTQAKIGIFSASLIGGILGYWVLSKR